MRWASRSRSPLQSPHTSIRSDSLVSPAKADLVATKGDLGKALGIKEVRTHEMGIAIALTAPEPPHIDHRLDAGQGGALRIELERAVHVLEVTPNVRDHHVSRTELGCRMSRFERPALHRASPFPRSYRL